MKLEIPAREFYSYDPQHRTGDVGLAITIILIVAVAVCAGLWRTRS